MRQPLADIAYNQWKSWADFLAGKTKNYELRTKPTDWLLSKVGHSGMIGGLATVQPLSHPLSPKLSQSDPNNFLSLSNSIKCLTAKSQATISMGVNARIFMSESCKKSKRFWRRLFIYSEFLALQLSSGEIWQIWSTKRQLVHKSSVSKRKPHKKREFK